MDLPLEVGLESFLLHGVSFGHDLAHALEELRAHSRILGADPKLDLTAHACSVGPLSAKR